ncbi:hypothetical protein H6F39_07375 [Anabaena sp. FACHB-1250]|uniref:beta strand repeat-containing protein n=1 Tax=Anabaena sp. FACHB-1250 TaxID=2692770 RepID=UPI001680631C|nr:bluetail domain-containing putative surface protein [Anabaena sp. FACHB-1250]MBD2141204.1 hypothetical protein [Anabaena sp. FACHB-1250]
MSQQNLVFTNPNEITIPNGGAATTYPSSINVSGLNGTITSLKVTLSNISHTYPDDLDVLLIGPTGAKVLLMSDAGWSWDLNNVTLTFDPNATDFLPDQGQISSGSYRATDYETGDRFNNSPAPSGNYGIDFSVFNNTIPNGAWNIYVVDDTGVDIGNIAGGWSIAIDTTEVTTKPIVTLATSTKKVAENSGGNILYTFTRIGNITSELTVNYTVSGSAIFNTDYSQTGATSHTATTGTVSFAAGADTVTLTISPLEDNIQENDETIILTLATATDYIIGTTTELTGTITNGNDQLEATGSNLVSNKIYDGGDGTDRLVVDYSSASFRYLGYHGLGVTNIYADSFEAYRPVSAGWNREILLNYSNIETFEITGTAYADYLRGYSGDDKLIGGEGNDIIGGGDGNDTIRGGDGNDTLKGEGGNDEIEGGDGNDTIDGGTGRHVIRGGTGNDTVVSAKAGDSIDGGEGTDTLQSLDLSSLDVDLVLNLRVTEQVSGDNNTRINNFENISSVTLGSGYDTTIATGNLLVSNGSINAGGGTDKLIVDYSSATFSGLGTNGLGVSNGYWSTIAFHDYRGSYLNNNGWAWRANSPLLSFSNIETFEITGTAYADYLRGYSGDDTLIGGEGNDDIAGGDGSDEIEGGDGNDTIDGGTGRHVIRGGTGDDTVVSAKAGDSIDGGEGTDTLQSLDLSSLDVDLVLNLRVTEQVSGDNNTRINNFENISSVTLGSGYDTTIATGNLLVSNGRINAGGGTDKLIVDYSSATFSGLGTNGLGVSNGYWSTIAFHDYRGSYLNNNGWAWRANSPLLSFSNIETFEITGTAYADYLRGYSGDDKLIGGEGNDDIAGGDGSDTIIPVNPNVAKPGLGTVDTVTGGTGEDTFILGDVTWIGYDDYNRTTAGTSDYLIIKDFNPLEDIIQLLGSSSDYTTTVSGNNINLYINKPDSEPDELIAVLENTQGLINSLQFNLTGSYFNYVASNAVLNITSTFTSSIQTEGNSDQKPFVFTVTRSGDTSGTSTVDWFITPSGNNPVNSTDFFGGAMPPGESLTFLPGETSKEIRVRVRGDSTIESNETFTVYLSTPSRSTIGTRSATGIILNDDGSQPTLPVFGTSGNDTLSGTINVDCLIGLAGNDTYTVNNAGDVVVENPSEGTDLVNASISYTLTDNFENLTLTGSANLNGTGNNLNNSLTGNTGNNILTGNAGNDTLNGGAGIDTLIGGLGDDIYVVDSTTDTITENSGEGTDIIQSSVTFDLTVFPNIENLTLTGTAVINGTGNAGDNSLTGNSGNNTLTGNAGNDLLNGGTGNDLLNGGAGADTLTGGIGIDTLVFQFGQSPVSGADRITDFAIGTDKIDLLTSLGVAMNAPTAFTRAANSTDTTLTNVVNSVFTDADGALTGNQALGVSSAALVSVTTSGIAGTYLVINDGVAGFQSSNDLLVNITGSSGILPALGTIAVSSFFI